MMCKFHHKHISVSLQTVCEVNINAVISSKILYLFQIMSIATSWSLVQSSPTGCACACVCVCVCVLGTSTVRRPWPERAVGHSEKKNLPRSEHSVSRQTFNRGTSKTEFNFLAVWPYQKHRNSVDIFLNTLLSGRSNL
jgi:hypothetical protein